MITLVNLLGLALLLVLAAVFAFIAVGVISVIADGARAQQKINKKHGASAPCISCITIPCVRSCRGRGSSPRAQRTALCTAGRRSTGGFAP